MKHDRHAMVPGAEPRSYYDQPVLKEPVWTVEIPWYLFSGGLAGASSVLSAAARTAGDESVARVTARVAAAAALASPVLLISDLGKPTRFLNMLRVFKPTSPMSVGSWILAAYGPTAVGVVLLDHLDRAPVLQRLAVNAATGLGALLSTYTAVLLADTAVPVWHESRRELPWAFAGGAAQSAAGVALVFVEPDHASLARRVLAVGAIEREAATELMIRRLGDLAEPLRTGEGGRYRQASRVASIAGVALALTAGRTSRTAAGVGGALATAGAVFERFAVFHAGRASAADPQATNAPQRRRVDAAGGPDQGR